MGRTGGAEWGYPDAGLEAEVPDIAFLPGHMLSSLFSNLSSLN